MEKRDFVEMLWKYFELHSSQRMQMMNFYIILESLFFTGLFALFKEQNIPISTEEWIKYLSEKAGVSEYYVAYGYQYLRSVAYWIYQAWDLKNTPEKLAEINMTEEDQQEICKWISEKDFSKLKDWIFQNE